MADLPASVGTLTITGRLLAGYTDSTDPGTRPDARPGLGTVTFAPTFPEGAAEFPLVLIPEQILIAPVPVRCTLDADGYLVPPSDGDEAAPFTDAAPGVPLIAPLQPGVLDRTDWWWTLTAVPATGQKWKGFTRTFTGAPGDELTLASLIPVPASPGTELAAWGAILSQVTAIRDQVVRAGPSLELAEDFATHSDGPLGGGWQITGANPPYVSGGQLTSDGTGYAWQALAAPVAGMACDVIWDGTGTDNAMTMAITSGADIDLGNLAVHFNYGPTGFNLTVREDGGAFVTVLSGVWRTPMLVDGATVYRLGFRRRGATVTVTGPAGDSYATTDDRIGRLAGRVAFWEPGGIGATTSALVRLGAYSDTLRPYTEANLPGYDAGAGFLMGNSGRIAGSRGGTSEVSIGTDPQTGFPGVIFGPVAQDGSVAAHLYADQFGNIHAPGGFQHGDGGDAIIYGGGPDGIGFYFSNDYDTALQRAASGVLRMRPGNVFRQGSGTTAQRPPVAAAVDALYRDTTLGAWIWSDGTSWRKLSDNSTA